MKKRSFITALTSVAIILIGLYLLLKEQMDFIMDDWKVILTILIFVPLTFIPHFRMADAIGDRPAKFANIFMGSILLKLMIGFLLFLIIALTSEKEQILVFGISFIVIYLSFTIFGMHQAMKLKDGRREQG